MEDMSTSRDLLDLDISLKLLETDNAFTLFELIYPSTELLFLNKTQQLIELSSLECLLFLVNNLIHSLLLNKVSLQPPPPDADPDHSYKTHTNEYGHDDEEHHGDNAEERAFHLCVILS
jgi:hypothetical protein